MHSIVYVENKVAGFVILNHNNYYVIPLFWQTTKHNGFVGNETKECIFLKINYTI